MQQLYISCQNLWNVYVWLFLSEFHHLRQFFSSSWYKNLVKMLALCSMLLPCYYAQNNASIMCKSLPLPIIFVSYIINTHFFHGNMWTHNWPAPNVCSGFIAQLVEHRTGISSNPVEVLNFFQASLRNCINCVYCDNHFFILTIYKLVARCKHMPTSFLTNYRPHFCCTNLKQLRENLN